MTAMKHVGKILDKQLPPMGDVDARAFLEDFAVSEDSEKPITCGLFRLESGEALTYDYAYHEMKLIVDGEFEISDSAGHKVTASRGDLFYFPKGCRITFTTASFGVGFFCGQRGEGEA